MFLKCVAWQIYPDGNAVHWMNQEGDKQSRKHEPFLHLHEENSIWKNLVVRWGGCLPLSPKLLRIQVFS